MSKTISRRTLLRGAGAAVALPCLEAMLPKAAFGAASKPPVRLAFFYAPNGIVMKNWKPKDAGALGELPEILKPLDGFKNRMVVLSNMAADFCQGNGAGHEPSTAGLLVGHKCKHSEEPEVGGISVDQLVARKVGVKTPVDSLALGIDPGMRGDHGYSGTYLSNMSWRAPKTPAALELNPKLLYDRIFRGRPLRRPDWNAPEPMPSAKSDSVDSSVLDLVREDAQSLQSKLGFSDRRKLEEYFEGLRSVEKRIDAAMKDGRSHHRDALKDAPEAAEKTASGLPNLILPDGHGIPSTFSDHVNLMLDILVLAFQTDTTRVGSFLFSNEKSGRAYPEVDAKSHHGISHHQNKEENLSALTRLQKLHLQLFARMVERMSRIPEGEGSLLDNVLLCYGSGLSDSNRHNHDDLPMMVVGGGGGTVKGGRHVVFPKKTTVCNLFLDLTERVGVKLDKFGDSTGPTGVLA